MADAQPQATLSPEAIEVLQRYARSLLKYERLMEISRKLNSTLKNDELLRLITEAAGELTTSEAASILLIDNSSGTLRFEAAMSEEGFSLEQIEVPMDSVAGWVVQNGEPVRIQDTKNDDRFYEGVDKATEFQTRSLLAVPLKTRKRTIGCLEAVNKKNDAIFDDDDENTLITLATQAAIAIENARLFEQSDLISEMVHELRTPLAAIKATTYILKRPNVPEETREEIIDTIASEVDRLTRLTTDFLELTRLESGRTRIRMEPIDFAVLVPSTVETVQSQAAELDVTLNTKVDGELPVNGDRAKLMQVLLNLLTNAIKYNRPGGSVSVSATELNAELIVTVADTGHGISQNNLPYIFEKFYRVPDTEGYTQGTGLGLAITKRIIENHGGTIEVNSVEGEGTTFTVKLPIARRPS